MKRFFSLSSRNAAGLVVFLCAFMWTVPLSAMDLQDGEWEMTAEAVVQGMQFSMPATKTTQCITKKEPIPRNEDDKNCTLKEQKITGNTIRWKVACKDRESTSVGSGEITYSGKSYKGNMLMTMTEKGGEPVRMTMKLAGRYLGPCSGKGRTVNGMSEEEMDRKMREMQGIQARQEKMEAEHEAAAKRAKDVALAARVPEEPADFCLFTPGMIDKTIECERKVGDLGFQDGDWEVRTEQVSKSIVAGKEHYRLANVRKETQCLTADDPLPVNVSGSAEVRRGKDRITWKQRSESSAMGFSTSEEERGGIIYKGDRIEGAVIRTVTSGNGKPMTDITKISGRRSGSGPEGCGRNYTARKFAGREEAPPKQEAEDVMKNPVKSFKKLFGW